MKRLIVVLADDAFGLTQPPPPGDQTQTRLVEAALKDTLASCQQLSLGPDRPPPDLVLAYAGDRGWYAQRASSAWLLLPQMGLNLAQRLDNLLIVLAPEPEDETLILGLRTPHLTHRDLQHAFVGISQRGACLGPTPEGGVYALGIRGRWPTGILAQVRWGEGTAARDLQRVLHAAHVDLALLETVPVLTDRPQLQRLLEELPACDEKLYPFLRQFARGV